MNLQRYQNGRLHPGSVRNIMFALTGLYPDHIPDDAALVINAVQRAYGFKPWREPLAIAIRRVRERRS